MTQDWQIENFLEAKEGRLFVDRVDSVDLAAEFGTPLFVFSEKRIRHNIARLQNVQNVVDCRLKICYAAKAMSTMAILDVVRNAGIDIEVNSGGELWKALKIGFTGEQIIFNGTSKEIWEIESAIENEIYAIQVDSVYELSLIEEVARKMGKRANVSLRLVPEIESNTHSGLQTALLTSKFGMMPDEALTAFREFKDSPHLNLAGIHLHIGSQNPDPNVYSDALNMLLENLLRARKEFGIVIKHVNLGGGYPVNYSRGRSRPPEWVQEKLDAMIKKGFREHTRRGGRVVQTPLPKQVVESYFREKMLEAAYEPSEAISLAWERLKSKNTEIENLLSNITLLLEPGRSIIADAGICLTTVRNVKERPLADINRSINDHLAESIPTMNENAPVRFGISNIETGFVDPAITSEHWLLTDGGFNILLSMETYKWYYHLISASRAGEDHMFPYKVAGPLCDGGDVYFDIEGEGRLPDHRPLPENVKPGEVLALLNCGAYSLAQASQYNGRFLPAVVLIRENGKPELIRKRDSFEDLISNEIF